MKTGERDKVQKEIERERESKRERENKEIKNEKHDLQGSVAYTGVMSEASISAGAWLQNTLIFNRCGCPCQGPE